MKGLFINEEEQAELRNSASNEEVSRTSISQKLPYLP